MNSYDMILACYIDELSVNTGGFMQRQEKIKVFSVYPKLLFNYVRLCVSVTVHDNCLVIGLLTLVELYEILE